MSKRTPGAWALVCVGVFSMGAVAAQERSRSAGQQAAAAAQSAAAAAEPEAPRVVLQAETTASVLRLMKFSGLLRDPAGSPRTGAVGLTFALYKDQQGGSPLWLEVHNAQLDEQGRYTVLLGSTKSEGLPLELFSTGEARWLGVQLNLPGEEEQPRVLLVSVPYALKAADAETLGGKPPSAFLLAEKTEGREAAATKAEAGKEAVKEGPPREGVVGPINGEGTAGFVAKFTGANAIGNGSIFDNGFVGIGTTSPTARLHIFEPEPTQNANVRLMGSGQTGSWMDIFAGTAVGFGLFGYGAQPFLFGVGAVERMRITPTGEVGLGTTSPNAKLSVGSGSIADASVPVQISTGTPGTVSYYGANKNGGYGLLLGYENGGFLGTGGVLRVVPADPLLFVVNNSTEAMRITSGGNVGVGTAAPTEKLEVAGAVKGTQLMSTVSTGTAPLTVSSTTKVSNLNADLLDGVDSGAFAVVAHNHDATYVNVTGDTMAGTLILPANGLVAGTNQLVLTGGNVGIGTAAPAAKLDVNGTLKVNGSVTIPTTTRILSIACAAFLADSSTYAFVRCSGGGTIAGSTAGQSVGFEAPVFLPDGATITQFDAVVKDSDGVEDITVALQGQIGASIFAIASAASSLTPGVTTLTDTASHVVDNSTNSYKLKVLWTVPAVTGNIHLYMARIHYTITTPLP